MSMRRADFAQLLIRATKWRDNILGCNVLDPANTNNSLSDDLTAADRQGIYRAAQAATQAKNWNEIF